MADNYMPDIYLVWWLGETIEQAVKMAPDTPEEAVQAYAEYFYWNRDGAHDTWPINFGVRCPDGTMLFFAVDVEYEPGFIAKPLKEDPRG